MPTKTQLQYLRPDCQLTLREGIAELRTAEGVEGDAAAQVAPDLVRDLDIHDAIHVVFGCPTSVAGEVIAHVWTLLGTTAKLTDLHRVNMHQDHRTVLAQIGHWKLLKTWMGSLPAIVGTVARARCMVRRWPVEELDSFLDRSLVDLRREFVIQLPPVPASTAGSGGAALRFARA
jgi:hypothetical protein